MNICILSHLNIAHNVEHTEQSTHADENENEPPGSYPDGACLALAIMGQGHGRKALSWAGSEALPTAARSSLRETLSL